MIPYISVSKIFLIGTPFKRNMLHAKANSKPLISGTVHQKEHASGESEFRYKTHHGEELSERSDCGLWDGYVEPHGMFYTGAILMDCPDITISNVAIT